MSASPTVSIIISAYNRPLVVAFAIKSVLASDFEDWELIVVGDGCNIETEQAVRAFTDPRIQFHNLPANTGHQSAPHNKGVELARGEFVLFLNQDDMYFPDHISNRVAFMRATGADISWSPILLLQHSEVERGPVDVEKDGLTLDGAVADGKFSPYSFIISSCWAVRREICHKVGPWPRQSGAQVNPTPIPMPSRPAGSEAPVAPNVAGPAQRGTGATKRCAGAPKYRAASPPPRPSPQPHRSVVRCHHPAAWRIRAPASMARWAPRRAKPLEARCLSAFSARISGALQWRSSTRTADRRSHYRKQSDEPGRRP